MSLSGSIPDHLTLGLFDLLSDLRNFAKEGRVDAFQKLYKSNKDLQDYLNLPIPEDNYSGTAAHYAALNGHFDLINYFREISKDRVQKLGKPKAITQDNKSDPEYFMHIKDSHNKTVAEIMLDHQVAKAVIVVKKLMKEKQFTRHYLANFTTVINKNYNWRLYLYVRFMVEQFLKFLSDDQIRKKLIPKLEDCLEKLEECYVLAGKVHYSSFRQRVLGACNVNKGLDDPNFLEVLKAIIYKTNNINFDLAKLGKFYDQLNENYKLKNYLYCTFLIDEFVLFLTPSIFLSPKIPHRSLHAFLDQFEDFSRIKLLDQLSMQLGLSTEEIQVQIIQLEKNVRLEFRKLDELKINEEYSKLDKEINDQFKRSNQYGEVYKIIMLHLDGLMGKIENWASEKFIYDLQKVINEKILIDKMMRYRQFLDAAINETEIRELLARRGSKEFAEFRNRVWKNSTTLNQRKEIFLKILEEIRFLLNKNYLTYLRYLFQRLLKNQFTRSRLEIKPENATPNQNPDNEILETPSPVLPDTVTRFPALCSPKTESKTNCSPKPDTATKFPALSPVQPTIHLFATHVPRSPLFTQNSPTGKANQEIDLQKIEPAIARPGSGQ